MSHYNSNWKDKNGPYCPRTWDGWQCWDDTPGGTTAKDICEGHIYFENDPPSCPSKCFFSLLYYLGRPNAYNT
ncbi:g_PROTEIN_RECEP_F2_3 domain-containing protein [Nephila pilipes]|uniref:G_PROTEIN_RECEP_F2_3 domain-containing protein n=1 Tax=Nephila pilipes TaxID=299642 RepID=A0A8X6NLC3_NEPPI|nr:g_PROTEIN_RECEP_F2_3 domain-containing protein [Nephila pilipes]